MATPKIEIKVSADTQKARKNITKLNQSIAQTGKKISSFKGYLRDLADPLFSLDLLQNLASRFTAIGKSVADVADSYNLMQAKLRLVTETEQEFAKAQQDVLDIARETRSPIKGVSDLYIKLARSLKSAGDETTNTAELTKTITQAMKVSGATTQETEATLLQLGQALASGVLRGEEFNSISEQGARITQALSDSLGVTTGELREMAKEGKLTATVVVDALKQQAQTINAEFDQLPLTIGDSLQRVKNSFAEFIGNADDATNLSTQLAHGIKLLADNFTILAGGLLTAGKALGAYFAINFIGKMKDRLALMQKQHAERKAQIEAVQQQQQAEKQLAAQQAQTAAIRAKIAANEATRRAETLRYQLLQEQAAAKENARAIQQLQQQAAQAASERQRNILREQQIRLTIEGDAIKHKLTQTEQAYNVALAEQNNLLRANAAAQKAASAAAAASIESTGRFKTLIADLKNPLNLLNLGFAAMVGYDIGTWAYNNFKWVKVVGIGISHLGAQFGNFFTLVKDVASANFEGAWDRYRQSVKQATQIHQQMVAELDKNTAASKTNTTAALENAEAKKQAAIAVTKEQLKQLDKIRKAEQEHLKQAQNYIDYQTELQKVALAKQYTNQQDYQQAVKDLQQKAGQEKNELLLLHLANQSQSYSEYYDKQIQQLEQQGKKSAQQQGKNHQKILTLQQEKSDKLRAISKQTLAALMKDAKQLAQQQTAAIQRSQSVLREYNDFVKQIHGDQRSEWQKNIDADKERARIEAELRKAAMAQQQGNFTLAKRLSEQALADAKALTLAEKARTNSLEKGTKAYVDANTNVTQGLALVKNAVDAVKQSSDSLADSAETALQDKTQKIADYRKTIAELDAQLTTPRHIAIDTTTANNQLDDINRKIQSLNQDIHVNIIEHRKQAKQEGGLIYRADGGFIPRQNRVPGTGSGDKVKALLEPGEFIIRKSAVQKFGEQAMYAINAGKDIIKRQSGGKVNHKKTDPTVSAYAEGGLAQKSDANLQYQIAAFIKRISKDQSQYGKNLNYAWFLNPLSEQREKLQNIGTISDLSKAIKIYNDLYTYASLKPQQRTATDVREVKKQLAQMAKILHTEFDFFGQKIDANSQFEQKGNSYNISGLLAAFAQGGKVPGKGNKDTVPAMLTPGEYVVRAPVVDQIGVAFLDNLNKGILPKGYQTGGLVGQNPSISTASEVQVTLNLNGRSATGRFSAEQMTRDFIEQLKQSGASA